MGCRLAKCGMRKANEESDETEVVDEGVVGGERAPGQEAKEVISVISIPDSTGVMIHGSFRYTVFPYWGDIDLTQRIKSHCALTCTTKKTSGWLQDAVREMGPEEVFSDLKAGTDRRFETSIGEWDYKHDTAVGYEVTAILRDMATWLGTRLITAAEYKEMSQLVYADPGFRDWDALRDLIAGYVNLHWTAAEVLLGEKKYHGKKWTLQQALAQKTLVKMDMLAGYGQGPDWRFVEVTNIYDVTYYDRGKYKRMLQPEQYSVILQDSIDELSHYRPEKYFKMMKRLWLKAKYLGDSDFLEKSKAVFQSAGAHLDQVRGDLDVLRRLYELGEPDRPEVDRALAAMGPRVRGMKLPTAAIAKKIDRMRLVGLTPARIDRIQAMMLPVIIADLHKVVRKVGLQVDGMIVRAME
jgi:hypothetical protein